MMSGGSAPENKDGILFFAQRLATVKEELEAGRQRRTGQSDRAVHQQPGRDRSPSVDIIYHELRNLKTSRRIPIGLHHGRGASGGYYIACRSRCGAGASSSVTGSIGVIMLTVNPEACLKKSASKRDAVTRSPRLDIAVRAMPPGRTWRFSKA